ncbi:hypothetical protein SAMN05216196_102508 [Lutimaribacter pacificus]|uniref:Uncharacterized protein n=1 Tax=Lutimaribacter pacificus TaxID=391948 RepID=A0A1H0F8B3_9RHOB|nr:hypothetical protein [Lutimaribacter pacificus]SDN90769.1 hypothetical protein SAMN05216196_102508 [Lutimaribacter pacificus]SHK46020.1 hypothetical protein SAMN05444142_105222 [Lutimaribacter pacificus]
MSGSITTWKNGRDRSREAERRAAEAARERNAREQDRRLAENERELAKLTGYREATVARALADERLREAARDTLLARRGGLAAEYRDGQPVFSPKAGTSIPTDGEIDAEVRRLLGLPEDG